MLDKELKDIRDNYDASTKGEWQAEQFCDEDPNPLNHNVGEGLFSIISGRHSICDISDGGEEDALFIANAHQDIPRLLDYIDKLKRERDEARLENEDYRT